MTTLSQLRQSTTRLRPGYTRKLQNQARPPAAITRMVPNERSRTLLIEGEVLPVTGDRSYKVSIMFFDMDVKTTKDTTHPMPIRLDGNVTKYARQFSLANSRVQVNCTCPDMRFVWSWWDNSIGSLLGRPRRYNRKTTTRPEVNPVHTPGLCKHLQEFALRLNQEGIVA